MELQLHSVFVPFIFSASTSSTNIHSSNSAPGIWFLVMNVSHLSSEESDITPLTSLPTTIQIIMLPSQHAVK